MLNSLYLGELEDQGADSSLFVLICPKVILNIIIRLIPYNTPITKTGNGTERK